MKKNNILYLLAALFLGITFSSCDDYLDVNKNIDAPDYVEGYLYLAGIEQQYQGLYWDLRAVCPLTQMMGTSSYSNFANHFYTKASDAAGEVWRMVYWNQGMNLENMVNQSKEKENWRLAGIGLAIKAFSWDAMTKLHGELPMKQAFVAGLLSHEYDYQEDIYVQVREWAKEAIELLQKEDNSAVNNIIGSCDYIYKGDAEKWIKFAYAVIARNLASLSCKNDFKEKYYNEFIDAVNKSFTSNDDNATLTIAGGGSDAAESAYNNWWGPYRNNLGNVYWQHDYAVELFTGSIPAFDEDGKKTRAYVKVTDPETGEEKDVLNDKYPYELAAKQITSDTLHEVGHFDPRRLVKLATEEGNDVATTSDVETLRGWQYVGSGFTSAGGPIATAPSFFCRREAVTDAKDGDGRWLYHNNAPYILTTYAELMFDLAEIEFKYGSKAAAFEAWKKAIAADMDFTAKYIAAGKIVSVGGKDYHQGDKVTAATFKALAQEYVDGPYVNGLDINEFSLSHIMMQKFLALFPWGGQEVWVDQRKYVYDIKFTGEYPTTGNGWDLTTLDQKMDSDPTKVYKGFYLAPAQVDGRKSSYNKENHGSPCFRLRPRYNSEYMWNKPNLRALVPIGGMAENYQCSMPWFAYPGDQPKQKFDPDEDQGE